MTAPLCICYTADPGYLFPSLVSAIQARQHSAPQTADVIIFSIGADKTTNALFQRACSAEGVGFMPIKAGLPDGADAMLARLFLNRFVPDDYSELLYLDGDTQIENSLMPLLHAPVLPGHFCAAPDPMIFSLPKNTRGGKNELSEYFSNLGLSQERQSHYFNSGVLRINRNGWDEIGANAWELFKTLCGRSRFPDQDALNLAAGERHIPMSLAWNFPVFLRNARLEGKITPHIVHYMGRPKPWHGQFAPWQWRNYDCYLEVLSRHPELAPYLTSMSQPRRIKYALQQRYKQLAETKGWGFGFRHRAILDYEAGIQSGIAPALPIMSPAAVNLRARST